MRIVAHIIRKAIFDALNGNVSYSGSVVPVYNKVPRGTSYPFIKIYGETEKSVDKNQSTYITETMTNIEIVTRFKGKAGGELATQQILDEVLQIIVGIDSSLATDSYNNFVTDIDDVKYLEDYTTDNTYYRAIAKVVTQTEQV